MNKIADDHDRFYTDRKKKVMTRVFVLHLALYLLLGMVLVAINVTTARSSGPVWFHWPLLGWGIGVALHGLVTHWGRTDAEEVFAYQQSRSRHSLERVDAAERGGPPR
jgi:uncharacterized integral membrane protein